MLSDQETIKKIKLFGLNSYEAKIWAAILSRNTSTAGELSDLADVPRSRSYDILESLEKKGFVVMKPGKPIKYLAVPPKGVLERSKKQIEKNTEQRLLGIKSTGFSNLINTFQEIYERNTDKEENIVAVLRGRKNIYKHLNFLFKDTKKELVFSVENEAKEDLETTNKTKDKAETAIKSQKTGLRTYVVGDDNTLLFPISEEGIHPDYDLCIWIRNKQITNFLGQLLLST